MRSLILALIMFSVPFALSAQSTSSSDSAKTEDMQTLIPMDNYSSGGFGAVVIKVGSINGDLGIMAGGRGGWVINRTFVIGGGGYGYTSSMHSNNQSTDTSVSFGYGGLELEYLIAANSLIHGTVLLHIGGGGFTVQERIGGGQNWSDGRSLYSTGCFVLEPAVNAEVNILSWLRLAVGVGYRFVAGIDATIGGVTYDNGTVSGFFGVGQIKFGPY